MEKRGEGSYLTMLPYYTGELIQFKTEGSRDEDPDPIRYVAFGPQDP